VLRLQGVAVQEAPAAPALTAVLQTPRGEVVLSSDGP
jgi:hypothetical protein